jgi:hypothetical protein
MYKQLDDIKRVMLHSHSIDEEFLNDNYGSMTPEDGLACIQATLEAINSPKNLSVMVKIATKYSERMTPNALIGVFERCESYEGLYDYLAAIVDTCKDPDVHLKYIVLATKMQHFDEVVRICRTSTVYDAVKVKRFLVTAKLNDLRPLMYVGGNQSPEVGRQQPLRNAQVPNLGTNTPVPKSPRTPTPKSDPLDNPELPPVESQVTSDNVGLVHYLVYSCSSPTPFSKSRNTERRGIHPCMFLSSMSFRSIFLLLSLSLSLSLFLSLSLSPSLFLLCVSCCVLSPLLYCNPFTLIFVSCQRKRTRCGRLCAGDVQWLPLL